MSDNIYQFTVKNNKGDDVDLDVYKGKVLLIVNTASKCGFTPQYKGLQALQDEFKDQGFEVLGFPCDQFGNQEPGDDGEIADFCEMNFGVNFPLFSKLDVNGANAAPLFTHLKAEAPGMMGSKSIKWNFTKFLVDRSGVVRKRFAPFTSPQALENMVRTLIHEGHNVS